MVAVLQAPYYEGPYGEAPPRARTAAERRAAARIIPLHIVPSDVVPDRAFPEQERAVIVHRQPRPRAARSYNAAVYWRRRLIAAALGLGIVLTATHAGAALGGSTTTSPERSPHVTRVAVQPGDTLWSIAQRVAPDSDPREVVDAIVAARGSADVQFGDVITWAK